MNVMKDEFLSNANYVRLLCKVIQSMKVIRAQRSKYIH